MHSLKKIALLLILSSAISSCEVNKMAHFKIVNSTTFKIDSLTIEASETKNNNFISLAPVESKTYSIDMSKIPMGEGSYSLKYLVAGKRFEKNFGYFENQIPWEKETGILIEMDTVTYQIVD
ncbi:MAG TPA: hypothetical protein VEC36_03135 [Patescibacteria group bacterium]|nr:hypothetical protein [Patescibacteria group bacterium]